MKVAGLQNPQSAAAAATLTLRRWLVRAWQ
jgi:hypothetical protein